MITIAAFGGFFVGIAVCYAIADYLLKKIK